MGLVFGVLGCELIFGGFWLFIAFGVLGCELIFGGFWLFIAFGVLGCELIFGVFWLFIAFGDTFILGTLGGFGLGNFLTHSIISVL